MQPALLLFFVLPLLTALAGCAAPTLRKVETVHMGQLTGTVLNNSTTYGISGTDLGASFVEAGGQRRLIFLFGDAWTKDDKRWDEDNAAWTTVAPVPTDTALPKLNWFVWSDGQFQEPQFPAKNGPVLNGMNVPVEGVAVNGLNYVFFQTRYQRYDLPLEASKVCVDEGGAPPRDPPQPPTGCPGYGKEPPEHHTHSALAHTRSGVFNWRDLTLDWCTPTDKFINVSAFVEGDTVWIYGTGFYRRSHIYLAKVSTTDFANRSKWEFYQGTKNDEPRWGYEQTAAALVASCFAGELSVRPHPELGYLMLYQVGDGDLSRVPRGVHLRRATKPWGPFELPINLLDIATDPAYGHFMHIRMPDYADFDDGLAEPGRHTRHEAPKQKECPGDGWRENCTGGEYGPYQIPQWARKREDGAFEILYVLSSWNPYQVHLMRSVLAFVDDPKPQPSPPRGVGLPPAQLTNPDFATSLIGWHSLGDPFRTFTGPDGISRMTTYTSKQDAAMGALYQDFTVDANTKSLSFWIHGGEAVVRLHRGVEIVRETRGRSGHAPRNNPGDTRVCWNIGRYAGETLRVAIFDGVDRGPWGFVGATRFRFHDKACENQKVVGDMPEAPIRWTGGN